jgi:hypothetical protein
MGLDDFFTSFNNFVEHLATDNTKYCASQYYCVIYNRFSVYSAGIHLFPVKLVYLLHYYYS